MVAIQFSDTVLVANGLIKCHIARATAICRNPLIRTLTGDKNLDQHLSVLCFYANVRGSSCFMLWTQHFDRQCVCNPTVQLCESLIVTNCVGCDKLLFHD